MVNKKDFLKRVGYLIDKNPNGFTANFKTLEMKNKGFAIGLTMNKPKDKKVLINNIFNSANMFKHLNNLCVGGWLDTDENKYYLDLVLLVKDKQTANTLSKEFKQIAFFDLENKKEIKTFNNYNGGIK